MAAGRSQYSSSMSCLPTSRNYLSSNTLFVQELNSFHSQCIPKEMKERVRSAPPRSNYSIKDYEACNVVKQEMIWEERCNKEASIKKKWDKNLGFLTEFDQYGEEKSRKQISKEVPSVYSISSRPLTASREYGNRVNTPTGQEMNRLQSKMTKGLKRNKDLLYYD